MTAVYTYTEARQNLASVLEKALREGEVRIRRRDGQIFVIKPERVTTSPLNVRGIDLDISTEDIIKFIDVGRRYE